MENENGVINTDNTVNTENTENNTNTESENVTMSKVDFDKKIQSETDKVRTDYVKKVKDLETKIKELTPVEKSAAELDFDKRLKDLEARENAIKLNDALTSKGVSNELAAYLRGDVDVDKLASVIDRIVSDKVKANSYKPEEHKSGENMTKEEFYRLPMNKREDIYRTNPELYKILTK